MNFMELKDGKVKIDVRLENETIWLTQQLMADPFQTSQQDISLHIQNIYEEGELAPEATYKKYLSVRREGGRDVKRPLDYYNLDMIISVRRIAEYKGKQDLYKEQSPLRCDFTIRDLQESCPHVGIDLIRRILREQRNLGRLECLGRGPNAKWRNR